MVTVPLPEPLAPLVIVNHDALLVAVQLHPVGAVTVIEAVPPAAAMVRAVLDSVYVHATPACVTVTVCPAIVRVALRDEVAVFAVAVTVTVPLPDPLAPLVSVSQLALLVAVQVQPAGAVTVTEPLPPPATMFSVVADSVYVQATPACVTVTLCPATVTVVLRDEVAIFAVAATLTVPFPDPLAPLVTVSQLALLVAVQVHPAGAVTVTEPLPPPATTFSVVADNA
jgi:hypothetical protein